VAPPPRPATQVMTPVSADVSLAADVASPAEPEQPAFKQLKRRPRELTLVKGSLKKKTHADGSHLSIAAMQDHPSTPPMRYRGLVDGSPVSILIDTGATGIFVSSTLVESAGLAVEVKQRPHVVKLADKTLVTSTRLARVPFHLQGVDQLVEAHVLDNLDYDLVLGTPWQTAVDAWLQPSRGTTLLKVKTRTGIQTKAWFHEQYFAENRQLDGARLISFKQLSKLAAREAKLPLIRRQLEFQTLHINALPEEQEEDETVPAGSSDPAFEELLKEFKDVVPPDPDFKTSYPPQRSVEHAIEIIPGSAPPSCNYYKQSPEKDRETERQLQELLDQGYIRPSVSPFGSPTILVKKKGGAMRFCIDYRKLNNITVKNSTPMPAADDLLEKLHGAKYFSKIDLASGYHQIRVKEADVHKTAFNTRFGHYEWRVLPFGLCNAPATFSRVMHDVLRPFLDRFCVCYLDDILIYSSNMEDHLSHVKEVLRTLRQHQLIAKHSKCAFGLQQVDFLGHVISQDGISMDPDKVQAVEEWPRPANQTDVLQFLGLTGHYRRFIHKFSDIAAPMSDLVGKDLRWKWGADQDAAFEQLKKALTTAPILAPPNPDEPFIVTCDASDIGVGACLSQGTGKDERVIAFMSRKLNDTQRRYEVHDRELLSVKLALEKWRHHLQGPHRVKVYTDNWATKFILTKPQLTPRQARWMAVLYEFNLDIEHKPGSANVIADALSRRPDHAADCMTLQLGALTVGEFTTDGFPDGVLRLNATTLQIGVAVDVIQRVQAAAAQDAVYQRVMTDLSPNKRPGKRYRRDFVIKDGLLYKVNGEDHRLYVPQCALQHELLQQAHDGPMAGHLGRDKMFSRLSDNFYWPRMKMQVQDYCRTCPVCQAAKSTSQKQLGLHQPLAIPEWIGQSVSMDFIVELPRSIRGHTAILVIVDRLTKRVALEPTTTHVTAQETAYLFSKAWFSLGMGLPQEIVSDRDPRFLSDFWQHLHQQLGVKLSMSTPYHPQTDGQTERVNRTLEDMLRSYVSPYQTDWDSYLPSAAHAINTAQQDSTKAAPLKLCQGWLPSDPVTVANPRSSAGRPPQSTTEHLKFVTEGVQQAKECLLQAQQRQANAVNKGRRAASFQVGDKVYLSAAFIKQIMPVSATAKLAHRFVGPFQISKVVSEGSAYQLALPKEYSAMHNVVYVGHLKAYHDGSEKFPWRPQYAPPPPPAKVVDSLHYWTVERFVGYEYDKKGQLVIHVIYKGYPTPEPVPASLLQEDLQGEYKKFCAAYARETNNTIPELPGANRRGVKKIKKVRLASGS